MTLTPNLKLEEIQANRKTWADLMNNNLLLIDAAIGAYFVIQNLQGIWENSHAYTAGQTVVDGETAAVWTCQVDHISVGIPSTFSDDRTANPDFWTVYSSPARARGAWTPLTGYAVNDFVVSGPQYAVCLATHTSSADFSTDVANGYWSILVDLSQVGQQVLPVLSGPSDANKFVATNSGGTGYSIFDRAASLALLGATSYGIALLQASSQTDARSAINAQVAGSYQAAAAYLAAISGLSIVNNTLPYIDNGGSAALAAITAFGRSLIDDADAATGRSTLGLGSAATLTAGTSANNAVQLDGSAKLPAVDGSALTGVWDTGDLKITMRSTAGVGWIKVDDGTIGSSASAATTRANDDTLNLYTLLYNSCSDALCPVSGGRGVSAAADFAANKTLRLTKMLGRALVIAGAGSGLTARTLGDVTGAETHNHGGATGASGTVTPVTGGGGNAAAAGHTHSIPSGDSMQPSTFVNVFIRL